MPIRKKKIGVPRGVSDDNFRIAKSDNKIKLFGKFNNRWYAVPMQDAFEVTNDFEAAKDSIITYNRKNKGKLVPNITATHDGVLTLRKKGTGRPSSTDVQLYNDGDTFQFRDSTGLNSFPIKAKSLEITSASANVGGGLGYHDTTFVYNMNGAGLSLASVDIKSPRVNFTVKCNPTGTGSEDVAVVETTGSITAKQSALDSHTSIILEATDV